MSDHVESVLQFNSYEVSSFTYIKNYSYFSSDEEITLRFSVNGSAEFDEGMQSAFVLLNCSVFDEDFAIHNVPFYLSLTMKGYFGISGQIDISNFRLNAVAILMPYLRSFITSVTSQSGIAPVILPPINVFRVFEEHESVVEQNKDN